MQRLEATADTKRLTHLFRNAGNGAKGTENEPGNKFGIKLSETLKSG